MLLSHGMRDIISTVFFKLTFVLLQLTLMPLLFIPFTSIILIARKGFIFGSNILSEVFLAPHCQTIEAKVECSHNFVLVTFVKVQSPKNLIRLLSINQWKSLCLVSETIFNQNSGAEKTAH